VYERSGNVDEDVWDNKVLRPSLEILTNFLQEDGKAEEVKATVSSSNGAASTPLTYLFNV
jgi:hypothetical protein